MTTKTKIRPNEPCPCGSGYKYKKCCSAKKAGVLSKKTLSRGVKRPDEIEKMRISGRFNAELFEYLRPQVVEGISTLELNDLAHEYIVGHGHIPAPLNYHGFPKSICTSLNDVVCHGIPKKEDVLKNGDIINIDITAIVDGYHGDMSETFWIGEVSEEAKKVTLVSKEALKIGIEAIRPLGRLYDVCAAMQDYVEGEGLSVVRDYTGHGVGAEFHEYPQVPHYRSKDVSRVILHPGMIFTIEPMVNVGSYETRVLDDGWTAMTADGSLSAQFEHTILVTESGTEVLTKI